MSVALIQLTNSLSNKTKSINELKKTILRPLIQLAVKSIEQEYIEDGILDRISEKYNLSQENIDEWYSVILKIIKTHLRYPESMIKVNDFKQCLQELSMENECIEDLCAVLYGQKRPLLITSLSEKIKFFPAVRSCRWRIDITISTSVLSRVMEPTILMEWTLSNGKKYLFELSLSKFHLMRYTVATLLLKMYDLEEPQKLNQ
ncbi:COMM domain-containing protein 5-like [Microplitis mediator]|uniref:COMM domain-containing protein 5-like n=1 Tax=Microplitis mediator TaxID=375433 RepID=UPI0025541A63|nr:COMM domain-containing protein 5-like [Microplitis mediator]